MTGTYSIEAINRNNRGLLNRGPWALCLGAGVNGGAAPSWLELTRSVVNEVFGANHSDAEFAKIVKDSGWSFDAWLQLCDNYSAFNGTPSAKDLIRKHIY